MITYLFPGQGSQHRGMGAPLFKQYPLLVKKANEILGYSIVEMCLDNSEEELQRTENAQPAIYVVNALNYFNHMETIHESPDFVAGHSLGEYNALLAAGVFDFGTGLRIVKKRGELMSQAPEGGMAAVIGLPETGIMNVISANNLSIDIANINTPDQIVISGRMQHIDDAEQLMIDTGARAYLKLKVGGAFHSFCMNDASLQLKDFITDIAFDVPAIPVIANVSARPYGYSEEEIRGNLYKQINSPVKWYESMTGLMDKGNMIFFEMGDSRVLTNMVVKIQKSLQ